MGTFRPTLISGECQGLEAESVSNGQRLSQSRPPNEGPVRTQKGADRPPCRPYTQGQAPFAWDLVLCLFIFNNLYNKPVTE